MGSELFATLKEQGLDIKRGGGEMMEGPPESFIIIGLDKSAEEMLRLYPDESAAHERARAIILGVRDKTRSSSPPPAAFVLTFARGQEEPGAVASLGPDRKGRHHVVVVKGRQRNRALRLWNEANPGNTWAFRGMLAPLKHNGKAGIDAEMDALLSNATSNVFVAMPESGKADHAAMLHAKGKSAEQIAISIGARDAEHVRLLLALAECSDAVQEAIDAGKVPLAQAVTLAKLPAEEQTRRVARTTAGASRAAKDGAAPPRAKTRPARVLESVERTLATSSDERMRIAAEAIAWARGGSEPKWMVGLTPQKKSSEEKRDNGNS